MPSAETEFAVLGYGVAGTAIAYELVRRKRKVKIIYRGYDGSSFKNQKWSTADCSMRQPL